MLHVPFLCTPLLPPQNCVCSVVSLPTGVCQDNDRCIDPYGNNDDCGCEGVKAWIGDGHCDDVNNNHKCKWDGGDCCRSTCVDGARTPDK